MPKVSIVISTYNRSSYICEAIDSVLKQDFKNFEIIVVDDGSTDNTKEVLSKYKNIRYIYQENNGRSEARNAGIKAASAEYVAFLDDDDIWLEGKLYKQVVFLDSHPETGLVHTFSEVVDEDGNILGEETEKRLNFYKRAIKIGYTYEGMSRLCIMFLSTVVVRKECFNQVGFFDGNIPAFEDWDFYLRFALKYKISLIPEILVKYKLHKKNTSSNEFIRGRIQTALKHLAMLDSLSCYRRAVVSFNFYMQLAETYYIASQYQNFRQYIFKAIRLRPLLLSRFIVMAHLLISVLPKKMLKIFK